MWSRAKSTLPLDRGGALASLTASESSLGGADPLARWHRFQPGSCAGRHRGCRVIDRQLPDGDRAGAGTDHEPTSVAQLVNIVSGQRCRRHPGGLDHCLQRHLRCQAIALSGDPHCRGQVGATPIAGLFERCAGQHVGLSRRLACHVEPNCHRKDCGIVFPISAFVALGFEHSIANLYLIPAGMMVGASGTFVELVSNLVLVTAGNLAGGAVYCGWATDAAFSETIRAK